MVRRRQLVIGGLLVGLMAGPSGSPGGASSIQIAKPLRPAAPADNPEEAHLKRLPPDAKLTTVPAPSTAEMVAACGKQPTCRQKLERAQKGEKPSAPLPAATTDSPDVQLKKWLSPPSPGTGWLKPFGPGTAEALTGFSVTLTPQNSRSETPFAVLYFKGATLWPVVRLTLDNFTCSGCTHSENRPNLNFYTRVPDTGWYIIDIRASRAKAKMRHLNDGPIIETWDFTTASTACDPCDYPTIEYLAAGYHWFYFWPRPSNFHNASIYHAAMQSYP